MSSLIGLMVNGVFQRAGRRGRGPHGPRLGALRRFHRPYRRPRGADAVRDLNQTTKRPTERTRHMTMTFRKTLLCGQRQPGRPAGRRRPRSRRRPSSCWPPTRSARRPTTRSRRSNLNTATTLIFDRLVGAGRRPVLSPLAGRKLGRGAGRHVLDLPAEAGRQVPQRRALQRRHRRTPGSSCSRRTRERLHGRGDRLGRSGRRPDREVRDEAARAEPAVQPVLQPSWAWSSRSPSPHWATTTA